jgi:hypothetical protein
MSFPRTSRAHREDHATNDVANLCLGSKAGVRALLSPRSKYLRKRTESPQCSERAVSGTETVSQWLLGAFCVSLLKLSIPATTMLVALFPHLAPFPLRGQPLGLPYTES